MMTNFSRKLRFQDETGEKKMRRIILDTNIYGRMVIDAELDELKNLIQKSVIVYGSDTIRKEIRKAPRWTVKYPKNLRMDLIRLYDILVSRTIRVTPEIIKLADNYYLFYRETGGRMPKDSIINDLLIIASASFTGLDIVVSEDHDTVLNKDLQKVYRLVNKLIGKRNPDFINYEEFKTTVRRSLL
jgi:predicted nucleic acid-binding protein